MMKKALSLFLTLCLLLALCAGCASKPAATPDAPADNGNATVETPDNSTESSDEPAGEPVVLPDDQPVDDATEEEPFVPADINVAVLKGSTGMGMAKLMADAQEGKAANNYSFTLTSDTADVMAKVISGEYQIAALPTNSAAMAYAKTEGQVQLLALNTLGVLYLLQQTGVDGSPITSLDQLRGKTITAFGQGANPEYILSYLLEQNGLSIGTDVTVDWKASMDEVLATLVTGDYEFVMLPEPNVTVAMTKNSDYTIALDLTQEWNKVAEGDLVMGCLVVRKDFADANPAAVAKFLEEYAASIDFITTDETAAAVIAGQEIVPAEAIAKKALPNCHIVCLTGADMQPAIETYFQVLFEANPQSVGGSVPDAAFYYGG